MCVRMERRGNGTPTGPHSFIGYIRAKEKDKSPDKVPLWVTKNPIHQKVDKT